MGLAGFNRARLRQQPIIVEGELEAPLPSTEVAEYKRTYEFECEICGKGFDKIQGILGHYRKAHPDANYVNNSRNTGQCSDGDSR